MRRILEVCRRIDFVLQNKGEIYIRCTGTYGQQLYYELSGMGIHVTAFLDRDYANRDNGFGAAILSP